MITEFNAIFKVIHLSKHKSTAAVKETESWDNSLLVYSLAGLAWLKTGR